MDKSLKVGEDEWREKGMDVEEENGKIEEKSFHKKLALDTILDLENTKIKNTEK